MEKKEIKKCCICGKEIKGYGNNASPLFDGVCCDECNKKVVLSRLIVMQYKNYCSLEFDSDDIVIENGILNLAFTTLNSDEEDEVGEIQVDYDMRKEQFVLRYKRYDDDKVFEYVEKTSLQDFYKYDSLNVFQDYYSWALDVIYREWGFELH